MDFENRHEHLLDVRHLRSGDVSGSSVEELLVSIIHEVSEPVTAVTFNAAAAQQALAMDPPDLVTARSAVQCLKRDSRDLVDMIQQLHAFFRSVKPNLFAAILLEAKGEAAVLIEDNMPTLSGRRIPFVEGGLQT